MTALPLLFFSFYSFFLACTGSDPSGGGKGGADDSGGAGDSGTPWWEEPATDADGDGYTAAAGDCDDANPDVHPGVTTDACNALDDDCDGQVDEDFAGDSWEPNDASADYLGFLDSEEQVLLSGYLFPETDVDRFTVDVTDGDFDWFSLEAWLYDVPLDADYALEIRWVADPDGVDRGVVASADDYGEGGYEMADWGGTEGDDDSGRYEIRVTSSGGEGCLFPYSLHIQVGWW